MKQWRCTVCDYIAKDASAPEKCPVCGSESSLFVAAGEVAPPEAEPAATSELRWQCTVCGYIHTGPEPPDKCPVCGVDSSQFVCLDRDNGDADAPLEEKPEDVLTERKWICKVCGYIHTGPEPPLECPVCGADQSQFEEVVEASEPLTAPATAASRVSPDTPSEPPTAPAPDEGNLGATTLVARLNALLDPHRRLIDLAIENHAHPISVHIPNGVLPIAVVMVLLATLFDMPALGRAGFYNMVFILLAMPFVLFTGYLHWQFKFGGHMTSLFKGKLISGAVVSVMALILVFWALIDSTIAAQPSFLYLSLHIVMLGVAAYAGYLGGRLVFHRKS